MTVRLTPSTLSARSARAIVRALVAAIGLTGTLGAGECGGGDDGTAVGPLDDFELTAPDGFAELVPTTTVAIAWQVTTSPALGLELDAVAAGEAPTMIDRRALTSGSLDWNGRGPTGLAVPPGNYQISASALGPDDGAVATVEGDNAHLVVVQGVRFRDGALTFTGGGGGRELVLTTVTRSPLELTLALDPSPLADGDELPLLTATIPGELVPTPRSYPFTGRTAADQPIAGGSYVLAALVRARGGTIAYRVDGPTLTWTP